MEDNEQKEFLRNTHYRTIRKQMLSSCNIKTLYELIDKKLPSSGYKISSAPVKEGESVSEVKQYSSDQEFVADFLNILEDELVDVKSFCFSYTFQFSERVEKMIRILENQAYYTEHEKELNIEEKQKYEAARAEEEAKAAAEKAN